MRAACWPVLLAFVVVSCAPPRETTNDSDAGRALIEQVLQQPMPHDPGPDEGGSALRDEIFADFEVAFDEYERAATAAVDCMRRQGFDVEGPSRYPDGAHAVIVPGVDPTNVLTWAAVNPSDEDRWLEVGGTCYAQWLYHVEAVWDLQNAPSEREVQEWLKRAWACGEENGLDLSEPPTIDEALEAVNLGCRPWRAAG
jgi:hypothetical protein